jgi:hypothetical protein
MNFKQGLNFQATGVAIPPSITPASNQKIETPWRIQKSAGITMGCWLVSVSSGSKGGTP